VQEFLSVHSIFGLFNKAIAESIIFQAKTLRRDLASTVKSFVIDNPTLGSIKFAQVVNGGLDTKDFDLSLQSKQVKCLYACGEVLNVDGDCGGYNLYWAIVSGIIAGENLCKTGKV
jgi:predicted flavoprotein YhiN